MRLRLTLALLALVFSMFSCVDEEKQARIVVENFFNSLNDQTISTADYYPLFDTLNIELKSDVVDYLKSEIMGDTIDYLCVNNYTDSNGHFKQDSIHFYIKQDSTGKFKILFTRGLVQINPEIKDFGYRVGAFKDGEFYNDFEIKERNNHCAAYFLYRYLKIHGDLTREVKIGKWKWETSYYGTANGDAWIRNNLPYTIYDVKYRVTYYDRYGCYMTQDEGVVCNELHPGEKYAFSFWSSNAKYPKRANIELVFSEEFIFDKAKYGPYSGNEYLKYLNFVTCGMADEDDWNK